MLQACEPVPSEEEQADEGGFQEERHHAFDRQRRAEDVTDIMGVIGPVGTELEFHGDAGCNTHGEIDAKQQPPEFHHVAPNGATGGDVDAFYDCQDHRQAQSQGHEQEVIHGGQAELQARKVDDIHSALPRA